MHPTPSLDHVFPLSQGSAERLPIRAPRLTVPAPLPAPGGLPSLAVAQPWAVRRPEKSSSLPPSWRG